jgi:hypothetical protein
MFVDIHAHQALRDHHSYSCMRWGKLGTIRKSRTPPNRSYSILRWHTDYPCCKCADGIASQIRTTSSRIHPIPSWHLDCNRLEVRACFLRILRCSWQCSYPWILASSLDIGTSHLAMSKTCRSRSRSLQGTEELRSAKDTVASVKPQPQPSLG